MTMYEPLDRSLGTLFADEAAAAAPPDLADRIVATTARLRPRPTWRARLDQTGVPGAAGGTKFASQSTSRVWLAVALALVLAATAMVAGALLGNRPPALRGVFVPAGSLTTPATKALLRGDGQILIFGGKSAAANGLGSLGGTPEAIIVYDPATGASREIGTTSASVSFAVPLANGRILAIESHVPDPGSGGGSCGCSDAELIEPNTGSVTSLPKRGAGHLFGAGVLLRDGRVLIVGDAAGTTEAELFDPAIGTFSATGSTNRPMMQPTATLLADGRVLVVGDREPVAELYNPATGTFTQTGPMSEPREAFTATILHDGRVVIAGGWATRGTVVDGTFFPSEAARLGSTVEIFDPLTGQFTQAGPMVTSRVYHFAVALADGRVLIGGGTASVRADAGSGGLVDPAVLQAELFDPEIGAFAPSGILSSARFGAGAVRLLDGRVLVIGTVQPSGDVIPAAPPAAFSLEVFE